MCTVSVLLIGFLIFYFYVKNLKSILYDDQEIDKFNIYLFGVLFSGCLVGIIQHLFKEIKFLEFLIVSSIMMTIIGFNQKLSNY